VKVTTVKASALLDEQPRPDIQNAPAGQKPFWDLERARIGTSRNVPVELLVNGFPCRSKSSPPTAPMRDLTFDVPVEKSAWIALRIRASSHTNPIFVIVDDKPIREKRSLEWCLKSVDQCWSQKEALIDPEGARGRRRGLRACAEGVSRAAGGVSGLSFSGTSQEKSHGTDEAAPWLNLDSGFGGGDQAARPSMLATILRTCGAL
jgi:hypothetical protein